MTTLRPLDALYPIRRWSITGYPDSGKTTFATQMRQPFLVVDADLRFDEAVRGRDIQASRVSKDARGNTHPDDISKALAKYRGNAATTLVDSVTTIISPFVMRAMIDNDAGRNKNRVAAFKEKAQLMRLLTDTVSHMGTDVLWIWHLDKHRDARAKEQERQTISRTELTRLTRVLNARLRIVQERDRRGVHVDWARTGQWGMTLWDEAGMWKGMPELLEAAIYADGSMADAIPTLFPDPETAQAWALDMGVFEEIAHARNAYELVKREEAPDSAEAMAKLWISDVLRRQKELAGG